MTSHAGGRAETAAALHFLCTELATRTLGTEGNRRATQYVEEQLAASGWRTERQPFDCLEWIDNGASLITNDAQWSVLPGPWSLPCAVDAPIHACATVNEIEGAPELGGRILFLHGPVAAEQLMPKRFPFYNPEEHRRIYAAIERKEPAAVLAATSRNPSLAGGIYPFPLIEDGNFDIPSAYMTDIEGARLLAAAPASVQLEIRSERRPASGWNVVARKGRSFNRPIVLCAHVDAKYGTPGAIDNAAGVVTLLQTAGLLADYVAEQGLEIVIFNGEDNYAAAGEIEYLRRLGPAVKEVQLALNVDGAGHVESAIAWSLYGCPLPMEAALRTVLAGRRGFVEGEPWYQSDHAIFVQAGVPALAFTTGNFEQVWAEIAHTAADTPDVVDCDALIALARAIREAIMAVAAYLHALR
jgi:aminopeptidase YwaD